MVDDLRPPPEPDPELAADLRALGRTLRLPSAPPDLASRVRAQLTADEEPAASTRWRVTSPPPRTARRRLGAVRPIAAVVLGAAVVIAASSQVRAGVADLFGLGGVTVQVVPSPATPALNGIPQTLPGETVTTLADARAVATFPVRVPASLGPPDQVVVSDGQPVPRVVTLLYGPGSGRPPGIPVAVRLDQFDGQLGAAFDKQVAVGAAVREVRIGRSGTTALWVDGPHPVSYVGRDGVTREAPARLSASTLIWQVDDVTFRLEGDVDLDVAVAVAASVR